MEELTVDLQPLERDNTGEVIMSFAICYFKDVGSNVMYAPPRARGLKHPRQYHPLVIKCPKCEARLTFQRTLAPSMDSCGFESYSLECGACGVVFAGIIDPYDEALLLSEHAYDAWGLSATKVLFPQSQMAREANHRGSHILDKIKPASPGDEPALGATR
jgi:hypothetical protein